MFAVNVRDKEIIIYQAAPENPGIRDEQTHEILYENANKLKGYFAKNDIKLGEWKKTFESQLPAQGDHDQSGIFAIMFVYCIVNKRKFNFAAKHEKYLCIFFMHFERM